MVPNHVEDTDGFLSPRYALQQAGVLVLVLVGAGILAVSSGWWGQMSEAVFQNATPQAVLNACAVGLGVVAVLAVLLVQQWRRVAHLIARAKKENAQLLPKSAVADRDARIKRLEKEKADIQLMLEPLARKVQEAEQGRTAAEHRRAVTEQQWTAEVEALRSKLREIATSSHSKPLVDAWKDDLEPFATANGEVYRIKAALRQRLGDYFMCPLCCTEGQPARLREDVDEANGRKSLRCRKHDEEWIVPAPGEVVSATDGAPAASGTVKQAADSEKFKPPFTGRLAKSDIPLPLSMMTMKIAPVFSGELATPTVAHPSITRLPAAGPAPVENPAISIPAAVNAAAVNAAMFMPAQVAPPVVDKPAAIETPAPAAAPAASKPVVPSAVPLNAAMFMPTEVAAPVIDKPAARVAAAAAAAPAASSPVVPSAVPLNAAMFMPMETLTPALVGATAAPAVFPSAPANPLAGMTPFRASPPFQEARPASEAPVPAPAAGAAAASTAGSSYPGLTPVHYRALRALTTSPILATARILSALIQAPLSTAEKVLDELSNYAPPLAAKTHTQMGVDGFGWKTTAEGAKALAESRNG
jgi:hypothetical protein